MTTPLDPVAARPDALIVAIANQKGGVGKSTTTINLGGALALQGERILLVDLDPQGNTSSGLGIDRRAIDLSTYEVLVDGVPIEDAVEPTSVRDLFVIPATIELAGAEIEMVSMFSREKRLSLALDAIASDFDFILIDWPAFFGIADDQRSGSRRRGHDSHSVRVLRARGSDPADVEYPAGEGQT